MCCTEAYVTMFSLGDVPCANADVQPIPSSGTFFSVLLHKLPPRHMIPKFIVSTETHESINMALGWKHFGSLVSRGFSEKNLQNQAWFHSMYSYNQFLYIITDPFLVCLVGTVQPKGYSWFLEICSNPQYSGVTYFILSNFCNFSQLVLSTHPLLLYQVLAPYQSFIVLSNFCHLFTLFYLLTFYFIYAHY